MANHARWAWLLALGVGAAAALANCSKDDEAPPGGAGKKTTSKAVCKSPKAMTVTDITATQMPGVLEAKAKGADGKEFTLRIELSDTPEYKQAPGSFDLSSEESYDGCRHCVVAYQGDQLIGATKQLFQTGGTLKLDTVSSPPTGITKGGLSKVELREVKIDAETAEISEVTNGTCYSITAFDWDTTPPPNTACQKAEDCGDPSSVACDPATGMCVAFQCEIATGKGCTDQQICLSQEIGASYGACHPLCTPFSTDQPCPGGLECVSLDGNQSQGKCLKPGTAGAGASCEPTAVSTGCAAGLLCIGPEDGQICQKVCDFYDNTVGCDAGQQCVFGGFCTAAAGDPAAIGASCSSSESTPCGSDGAVYRGVCVSNNGSLTCQKACRVGSVYEDCSDTGQSCIISEGESALPTCQTPVPDQEEP